ncbi:MAG: DUF2147 domain-containing protein [Verrucomicrobia bacterium]|nr:DUF2147 domain-containing protein [Verrucomicrobiota bacterium]
MKALLSLLVVLSLLLPAAFADDAGSILGQWETDKSIVEIYERDGLIFGKLAILKEPLDEEGQPKLDKDNPDESLRTRPVQGLEFMWNFKQKSDTQWGGGKIYDPKNGKTYYAKITLEGTQLKLRGSIDKWGLAGRTATWTRYEEKDE